MFNSSNMLRASSRCTDTDAHDGGVMRSCVLSLYESQGQGTRVLVIHCTAVENAGSALCSTYYSILVM